MWARDHAQVADGGAAQHRLPAEPQSANLKEVVGDGDLAGGVPLQREHRVLARHPAAVVGDLNELAPGFLDHHLDIGGAGVERVLHQFLYHRGGTLDDFAGGDLIGQ
ncbi:MAG: hypothetical protein BWY76_02644 [bacterium ADurb.Bin429]|nr:MAG: hypothetical protein BWY76_02644 [bacterium ADurb.Bin429]